MDSNISNTDSTNLNIADTNDKLDILKIMYISAEIVCTNKVLAQTATTIELLDLDGNKEAVYNKEDVIFYNEAFITFRGLGDIVLVRSNITNKEIILKKGKYGLQKIKAIGSSFLMLDGFTTVHMLSNRGVTIVINTDMEIVVDLSYESTIGIVKVKSIDKVKHKISFRDFKRECERTIILSDYVKKAIMLDVQKIDETCEVGATSICKKGHEYTRSVRHIDNLRYCILKYGSVISKEYDEIFLDSNLVGTEYLMAYEVGEDKKPYAGIISRTGREVIPAEYESVEYIGNRRFILENKNFRIVYEDGVGAITEWIEEDKLIKNDSLPIVLINNGGKFEILDQNNEKYPLEDFTKHYDCYVSTEDRNMLRVNIVKNKEASPLYKYVTTSFVPITNLSRIAVLNLSGWERIN